MQFLANENVPGDAVARLRSVGHDVAWVREDAPGSRDEAVLARAIRESRILLTFDKDFGGLALKTRLPPACGVILLRLEMPSAISVGHHLANLIDSRDDWAGHFSVIEPGRVRMRPLPPG